MKVYAISGLGADERAYQNIKIDFPIVHLNWIAPLANEPIEAYALRLAADIDTSQPFALIGVSFGGLIAVEMSKKLNPVWTFIISSVEVRSELSFLFRFFGKLNLMKHVPAQKMQVSKPIAHFFFQTKSTALLDQILDESDMVFSKWAVQELMQWKNTTTISNCTKISGSKDRLMPPTDCSKTILVEGGTHFMIVDRAAEISLMVNNKLIKLLNNG